MGLSGCSRSGPSCSGHPNQKGRRLYTMTSSRPHRLIAGCRHISSLIFVMDLVLVNSYTLSVGFSTQPLGEMTSTLKTHANDLPRGRADPPPENLNQNRWLGGGNGKSISVGGLSRW